MPSYEAKGAVGDVTIFVCRAGAMQQESKEVLQDAGVVVVELDDPAQFRLIRAGQLVDSNQMLGAALKALAHCPTSEGRAITAADHQRTKLVQLFTELYTAALA